MGLSVPWQSCKTLLTIFGPLPAASVQFPGILRGAAVDAQQTFVLSTLMQEGLGFETAWQLPMKSNAIARA